MRFESSHRLHFITNTSTVSVKRTKVKKKRLGKAYLNVNLFKISLGNDLTYKTTNLGMYMI